MTAERKRVDSMDLVLYIHGKGGAAAEAEHYRPLFPGSDVIGLDYRGATPWEAGAEIQTALAELKPSYNRVTLIANSIGAYFSMHAGIDKQIDRAYFISPILDMEKLIDDMLAWAGVTEEELRARGRIRAAFGEDLSWDYLCYVREHPVRWDVPTEILYGEFDELTALKTMEDFARAQGAGLTVMPGGEHWFHTPEQMCFLDHWLLSCKARQMLLARSDDLPALRQKYIEVIAKTPDLYRHARWEYGKHPYDALLQGYMDRGEMLVLTDGREIAGMMALTMYQAADYHGIPWASGLPDGAVAVIHILAVCPDYAGLGVGRRLVREAVTLARANGKKAVRLDVLESNTPAQRLYESEGFTRRGKENRYAENTGWTDFLFYDYML